jgi:hypothetical protein
VKKKTFPLSTIWKYNENNNLKKGDGEGEFTPLIPCKKE